MNKYGKVESDYGKVKPEYGNVKHDYVKVESNRAASLPTLVFPALITYKLKAK
jgi:hypothetical protein